MAKGTPEGPQETPLDRFLDLIAQVIFGQRDESELKPAFDKLSASEKQKARNEFFQATGKHFKY